MRNTVSLSALALLGLAAAVPAHAMPFPPLADQAPSAITLTAGGCGIGFHRGPYGGCRPNGGGHHAYGITRTLAPTAITAAVAGGAAGCGSATSS